MVAVPMSDSYAMQDAVAHVSTCFFFLIQYGRDKARICSGHGGIRSQRKKEEEKDENLNLSVLSH